MLKYINTLQFMLSAMQDSLESPEPETKTITLPDNEQLVTDIYHPPHLKKPKGCILIVHGMNKQGRKDPRLICIAKAAARIGFRVFIPDFVTVINHMMLFRTTHEIAGAITSITDNKSLCPGGRLGLFCASFTAIMVLYTASFSHIRHRVSSICMIGAPFRPKTFLTYAMSTDCRDHYVRYIVLKNFLHKRPDYTDEVETVLNAAIADEFDDGTEAQLEAALSETPTSHQERLTPILFAEKHGIDLTEQFSQDIDYLHGICMEVEHLPGIEASVILIHAEDDEVISSQESVSLHNALKEIGIETTLVITPLFGSHADFKISPRYFKEVAELTQGFHRFFLDIERKNQA